MGTFNVNDLPTSKRETAQKKGWEKISQFKELSVGAGLGEMKHVKDGVKFQDKFYFIKANSVPILRIDQTGNIDVSADAYIGWASGRKITAGAAAMTADGDWLVLGGVRATGYTTRVGSTDYAGVSSISEGSVDTFSIEIKGGIVTNFQKNS